MALFNKLFSSTKRKGFNSTSNGQSPNYLSNFPFDACQVRILLYHENDNRRRLLFDSLAVTQVNINDNHINNNHNSCKNVNGSTTSTTTSSINTLQTDTNNKRNKNTINPTVNSRAPGSYFQLDDGMAYQHTRPTSKDIASIGEMVFGALAMSFRGTALKVHWLQSPPSKLLCSQVFLSPSSPSTSIYSSCTGKSGGCANSLSPRHSIASDLDSDSLSMNSFSMPFSVHVKRNSTLAVDVPEMSLDSNSSHNYPDSGFQDPWTTITSASSYQYSTRSSIGSILSDNDSFRKNSLDSSYMSSTFSSKSSDGSLQRRISRNLWTSFENRNSVSDFIGFIGDNSQSSPTGGSEGCVTARYQRQHIETQETHSNPEIRCRRPSVHKQQIRREKLGLAICITMSESFQEEMEQYCCEHMALFESMLCRLRAQVEQAYLRRKDFFQIMVKAWLSASQWVVDFFTAPRLNFPVWLNITTSGNKYSKNVADKFMKELCWMLSYADTKDTNFFVSTMLTGILTYHLGWVTTVAAYNSKSKENAGAIASEQRAKLLEVSHKHPYNALWGQLGDLYGAIGNPPKLSRTIIYGQEKMMIEKLLYVMTYFIRCSEVRRATKKEVFNKDEMDDLINQNSINNIKNEVFLCQKKSDPNKKDGSTGGLRKSKTCSNSLKHLNLTEEELNEVLDQFKIDEVISINKKNEIPNVLAFRDSRLVKQELRIGNYLMDTGIEKSAIVNGRLELGKLKRRKINKNSKSYALIKLLVTTPENVEMAVDSGDEAEEALENGTNETDSGNKENKLPKHNLLWSLMPETPSDGISLQNLSNIGRKDGNRPLKRMGKSQSFAELNGNREFQLEPENKQKTYISLSDLITANSMGNSQRMSWGIEPIKETVTLEEEKHFEMSQKRHAYMNDTNSESSAAGVVFVLGDNEALVNIKKSTESLVVEDGNTDTEDVKDTSLLAACTCPQQTSKKHSGVKFNFEQYPQIATNYMKNKNIDLTGYNFTSFSDFNKKSLGEEASTTEFTIPDIQTASTPTCEYCKNQPSSSGSLYQTPSNATELEFDTDGDHCYDSSKSDEKKTDLNSNGISLLKLPVPIIKDTTEEEKTTGDMQVKAGYVPSLLVGVSDHYISDMVLQGTLDSPENWERKLKDDLMLSSHSASLNPTPTENVALIADMEEWDVKLICPQINHLPTHTSTTASTQPIGMSQLVSSMLETVYAMSTSGISAYECLAFLESKLQEMYIHSETLAAFLLATEFCSLNTVTSSLNLSANDIPLLLSVASIHTPQVTRKCGISWR